MNKHLFSLLPCPYAAIFILVVWITGCAMPSVRDDTFSNRMTQQQSEALAIDAAIQIAHLYSFQEKALEFRNSGYDLGSRKLMDQLRLRGFAVYEVEEDALIPAIFRQISEHSHEASQSTGKEVLAGLAESVPVSYKVDHAEDVYFVKLNVAQTDLTRAYHVHDDVLKPAGLWVKREP